MGESAAVLLGPGPGRAEHPAVHGDLRLRLRVHGLERAAGHHGPHRPDLPDSHAGDCRPGPCGHHCPAAACFSQSVSVAAAIVSWVGQGVPQNSCPPEASERDPRTGSLQVWLVKGWDENIWIRALTPGTGVLVRRGEGTERTGTMTWRQRQGLACRGHKPRSRQTQRAALPRISAGAWSCPPGVQPSGLQTVEERAPAVAGHWPRRSATAAPGS